jgi:glycosyltransferase involved in cell wall biosynthesis
MVETWRHTKGQTLRRVVITGKSVGHYRSDELGFRNSDLVVAPTAVLAEQLASRGIPAVTCFPPCGFTPSERASAGLRSPARAADADGPRQGRPDGLVRLVTCCGDLGHPRKNVKAALEAAGCLARRGIAVEYELIGGNAAAVRATVDALPPGVRVAFSGLLEPAEVYERVGAADVFVFPTLFDEWGYVVPEALICGTPVASFPVYPYRHVLTEDLGRVAGDMTPESLARAIEGARTIPRERVARRAEELFGLAAVGRRLTEIWSGQPVPSEPALR